MKDKEHTDEIVKRLERRVSSIKKITEELEERVSKIEKKIGRFTTNNLPIYSRLDDMVDDINRIEQNIENLKSK